MPEISDWSKGPFAALGAGVSFSKGDYEKGVQQILNSAGFTGFAFGRYSAKLSSESTRKAFAVETKILWYGILYCMGMQLLYLNASDSGKEYSNAQHNWKDANTSLDDAEAESWGGWTGTGADAYNKQNAAQMTRATTISGIDQEVFELLAEQSKQVRRSVLNIGWEQTILTCLIPICSLIYKTQPEVSLAIQGTAVGVGVVAALGWVAGDLKTSGENAGTIRDLQNQYSDVGNGASTSLGELTTGFTASGVVAPGTKSTVAEFESPGTAAPLAAESWSLGPDTAPQEAPRSHDRSAPPFAGTASAADSGSGAGDSEDDAPATPGYSVPTLSQVMSRAAQASTQAAKFSKQAGVHLGLVNKTLGTVQQMASMVPSGASAGAEPAERAPVGVGVGEQAEQPQRSPYPIQL